MNYYSGSKCYGGYCYLIINKSLNVILQSASNDLLCLVEVEILIVSIKFQFYLVRKRLVYLTGAD